MYFAKPADGVYGWAGADYSVWGNGVIEAIDYQTGKIRWSHEVGSGRVGGGSADDGFRAHFFRRRYGKFSGRSIPAMARLYGTPGQGRRFMSSPITL